MSSRFIPVDRETRYILPPSLDDWLPENHLARFVLDVVSQLDLRPIVESYSGRGSRAHHPAILLSLLFYGYATGTYSSRKIEQATYDSVAFRFISGNTHPDHDTIATFRKRFLSQLQGLFLQILLLAREAGILKLGTVSLDGTKIKANASKHHALSWSHACKIEKQLKEEIKKLMELAEKADNTEYEDGMSIPKELERRENRLAAIANAKVKIKERAGERYKREKAEHDEKMAERENKAKKTGKKPRGRAPKPPEPGPKAKDQVNLTDEESRIMPTSGKSFIQAYNAQASVDTEKMLIVGNHLTQCTNDKLELLPAISDLILLPEKLGHVKQILADTGYFSADNVKQCESHHIQPLISPGRDKHNQPLLERFAKLDPLSPDADPVSKMKHRLKTKEGREQYAKRKHTVEPVFGIIKHVMNFRQFLLRGVTATSGEWTLVCIAWNIKRLFALSG